MGNLPLDGVTVIAIEQAVAAPFATARLADAGARVIKIERKEGDFARFYDAVARGQSSYFVWLNRGKQSVVLDLTSDEGKARLTQMLQTADVLVQNLKPGALARLGFDAERLARDYPRLIAVSISGYGEAGPMAERKAYDLLIQAESGLCSITGGPEAPSRVGISLVDTATGATAHAAILEALIQRGITGKGAQIQISMFDVMADWLTVPVAKALINALGRPIAAPSANLSGQITATTADEVLRQLGGRVDAIIQSGPTAIGVESSIVDLTGAPTLLRHGAVTYEELAQVFPNLQIRKPGAGISAPGQLESHYAPKGLVRMNIMAPGLRDFWIGFGPCPGCALSLSPSGDLDEAARNLFAILTEADLRLKPGQVIAFAPIPELGIGRAINDRLRRATAPRGPRQIENLEQA